MTQETERRIPGIGGEPRLHSPEVGERDFAGKVVLITGASRVRGIGAEIARQAAVRGAKGIVLTATQAHEDEALSVQKEIEQSGTACLWMPGDIIQESTAELLVKSTVDAFGRLDVVFSNAGMRRDNFLIRKSPEDFRKVFDVNFFGAVWLAQKAVEQMTREQKPPGGKFVFTSSLAYLGSPMQTDYSAAKGALVSFSSALGREYARRGIESVAVVPGLAPTDMVSDLKDPERQGIMGLVGQEQEHDISDVAQTMLNLASPKAQDVNARIYNMVTKQFINPLAA